MDNATRPDKKEPAPQSMVERIDGDLHAVRTIFDESGNVLHRFTTPLMVEFRFRDVCQILVGSCALSIPVAYTEEVWTLGENLPTLNLIAICLISIAFVASFGYYVFYKGHLKGQEFEFVKRVIAVYLITSLVSVALLTMLQKCPWMTDPSVAIGRVILVAFPGCFGATVVDSLK